VSSKGAALTCHNSATDSSVPKYLERSTEWR